MGHSRPMHSAPVPINVRCYSNSDMILRRREVTLGANRRHSLGYSIGRSSNMSPLVWLAPTLVNPWNFMASGELRLQQMSKAGRNPQRFY